MAENPFPGEDAPPDFEDSIVEFLEQVKDLDPEAREYYEKGCIRTTTALTPGERERVDEAMSLQEMQTKQCYRNAQLVAIAHNEFAYVEGYTMSESVPVPIQHAWVELNGKVVELTFSDGPETRDRAAYFGVEYDDDSVDAQVTAMECAYPMANERAKATRNEAE